MSNNRGFTLIEILIVLVIIGITMGFAIMAFGDFGEGRRILFSAEQFVNTVRLAQQQAQLETSTLGLRINNGSYQILKWQSNNRWNPLANKGVFKATYFPKNSQITLKSNYKAKGNDPCVIINAAGDMTPFSINFGTNKQPVMLTVIGSAEGILTIKQVEYP